MEFLPTVSLDTTAGEVDVWNHLKEALRAEEGFAFLRYPVFPEEEAFRFEPDILLLHRQWGLVVIEVKGCRADQVASLDGHVWRMNNWYQPHETPFEQAQKQAFALRRHFHGNPALAARLRTHALVALPFVTEDEWRERGFTGLPCNPRIIHQNQLTPARLRKRLQELTRGDTQPLLSDDEWALACRMLGQQPVLAEIRGVPSAPSGHPLIDGARGSDAAVTAMDLDQLRIGWEIPPGPQRIRGIAGSGKTLLLAMKAARMHLSHPDWDIAFTFNTKSLYQVVRDHIRRFCLHQGGREPNWGKLKVMHAWGGASQVGLYSHIAGVAGHPARSSKWAEDWLKAHEPELTFATITDKFTAICKELHGSGQIRPCFDAILIDEGQDLFPEFYKMAYDALREPKRLIWAYDEAQSLDHLRIPNAEMLFGRDEKTGKLLVDLAGQYPKGIQKSHIMRKCYRTPAGILMPAHAFGMGLLRPQGAVQMITTQQGWQAIGYQVEGSFDAPGREVTLTRPTENCPHPLDRQGLPQPLLKAKGFGSREAEMRDRATEIARLCEHGATPDEVLVVFLGPPRQAKSIGRDMEDFARLLDELGIAAHIADDHPDAFRRPHAVTLSRIHRAKGNEATFVYVVGLDRLAQDEARIESRNQLFVALTRTRSICRMSGLLPRAAALLEELSHVLAAGDRLEFRTPGGDGVRELDELTDLPPVVRFGTHLPLYDLKARAGLWPRTQVSDPDDVEWISAAEFGDLTPQLFAVRVEGDSMAPRIADGSVAVFQRTEGVPEGKVVLVARRDPHIDDAVSLLVKQLLVHQQPHGQVEYRLRSYNDAYADIALSPEELSRIEFVGVLKWGPQTP